MLLYDLAFPSTTNNKGPPSARASLPLGKLRLLHRTEYPFSRSRELFCFASSQKFYFDGLRLRRSKDGKLGSALQYPAGLYPKKALLNLQGSVLAILAETEKQNPKSTGKAKPKSQILLYKISQLNQLNQASYLNSIPLASGLKAKAQSLAFHPNGRILGLADQKRKLYFFAIP